MQSSAHPIKVFPVTVGLSPSDKNASGCQLHQIFELTNYNADITSQNAIVRNYGIISDHADRLVVAIPEKVVMDNIVVPDVCMQK
jgi:hypothetical protein